MLDVQIPFQLESSAIDQQISTERLTIGGLLAGSLLGLLLPVLLPQTLIPQWAKTALLGSGVSSAIGLTVASAKAKTKQGIYQTIEATKLDALRTQMQHQIVCVQAQQRISGQLKMLDLILQLPPEMQAHYIREYQLEGLIAPVQQALRSAEAIPETIHPLQRTAQLTTPPIAVAAVEDESTDLPDGAELIKPSDIGKINKYPVVMVIADPGSGKTETMTHIFERLDGVRILASPDAAKDPWCFDRYEMVFGSDPKTMTGGLYGTFDTTDFDEKRDLDYFHKNNYAGTMLEFSWAAFRCSQNRQKLRTEQLAEKPTFRVCFDEAAQTFTNGFKNPFESSGKNSTEEKAKNIIRTSNAELFFNGRKHKIQFFIVAQTDGVDSVGLNGLSALRDDMWQLYPGMGAIAVAEKNDKPHLANWLRNRLNAGYGIALLEKQGVYFHVIDLPLIEELKLKAPGSSTPATPQQPGSGSDNWLDDLKRWAENQGQLTDELISLRVEQQTGRVPDQTTLAAIKNHLGLI